jgi:DMSO/TMAO reductase YedYZ molybdopterin-dependent catalytic subunit
MNPLLTALLLVPLAGPPEARPLLVGNEAGKVVPLPPKDWEKLPRGKVEVKDKQGRAVTYEGVPVAEVLRFAGVPLGGHLRGPRVANYVLVEAADGYRAVLALAEVDPGVAEKLVLLADRADGKQLPGPAGPYRLVVPGDRIHSRWVRQVIRITVQQPPRQK